MLIKQVKDKQLRALYNKTELQHRLLKFLYIRLLNLPRIQQSTRLAFFLIKKLKKLYKLKSKTQLQKRCIVTNRGRGNLRSFGISRLVFLDLCRFGVLPGYTKAVW